MDVDGSVQVAPGEGHDEGHVVVLAHIGTDDGGDSGKDRDEYVLDAALF